MPIQTECSGIYKKRTIRVDGADVEGAKSLFRTIADGLERAKDWHAIVEAEAREILKPYPKDKRDAKGRVVASGRFATLPKDAPPRATDAAELLTLLGCCRDARARGDHDAAESWAFQVGVLSERMGVRPFEPHAVRGMRTLSSAKRGHSATHGSDAEKQERWNAYAKELERMRASNPALSHMEACRGVARKFNVHSNTVYRHVPKNNPK